MRCGGARTDTATPPSLFSHGDLSTAHFDAYYGPYVSGTGPTQLPGAALQDRLVRTFEVVSSRLTAIHTSYGLVTDGRPAIPDGALQSTWTSSAPAWLTIITGARSPMVDDSPNGSGLACMGTTGRTRPRPLA